jgi:hypothetical protein
MADDNGALFTQRRHQRDHVANEIEDAVGTDLGGRAGATKAAHIRRDDVETGLGDGRNLVPPGI